MLDLETSKLCYLGVIITNEVPPSRNTLRPGGFALTRHALCLANFPKNAKIIDIGCGYGATVKLMREEFFLDALGIDSSPTILDMALTTDPTLPLTLADGANLPYEHDSLGGAIVECVLSTTMDRQKVLNEINRVLKPGGKLIITDMYLREQGSATITSPDSAATFTNPDSTLPTCLDSDISNSIGDSVLVYSNNSTPICPDNTTFHGMNSVAALTFPSNATSRNTLERELIASGFRLMIWEDHLAHLKQMAAELILEFGVLPQFLTTAGKQAPEPPRRQACGQPYEKASTPQQSNRLLKNQCPDVLQTPNILKSFSYCLVIAEKAHAAITQATTNMA